MLSCSRDDERDGLVRATKQLARIVRKRIRKRYSFIKPLCARGRRYCVPPRCNVRWIEFMILGIVATIIYHDKTLVRVAVALDSN